MKILIVGAGISGLTLACFLKRHTDFEIDIVDKAPDWSHLGYTIGIWDLGRRILSKLDLDEEFDRRGREIHSFYLTDKNSKDILRLYHFDDFYKKYESAYTHIARRDLHQILLSAAACSVRMETSPKTIEQKNECVKVTFSDGSHAAYDFVIGADGLHSQVRTIVFPDDTIDYTGHRVWFAWVPQKFVRSQSVLEIVGENVFCDLFDDPTAGCVVFTAPEIPKSFDDPATRIKRLRKHFVGFGYPIPEILDILKTEDLLPSDIGFIQSSNWVKNRVILIGDAAHAMEPYAGIGASVGMEDAYVLADELSQLHSPTIVDKALARYVAMAHLKNSRSCLHQKKVSSHSSRCTLHRRIQNTS
jgi:2-polyprenyl-6-methoxyphenol hydroxylase-like FAD-dependent oxidoreductase